MPRELITKADYARRKGVTPAAVGKALKKGRISLARDGYGELMKDDRGRDLIDPAEADAAWEANTRASKATGGTKGSGGEYKTGGSSGKSQQAEPAQQPVAPSESAEPRPSGGGGGQSGPRHAGPVAPEIAGFPEVADSDRREKYYKALEAELRYQEKDGQLVRVEDVERRWFEWSRGIRDAVMGIPDRIAARVAAEFGTTGHVVQELMDEEIRTALQEFVDAQEEKREAEQDAG